MEKCSKVGNGDEERFRFTTEGRIVDERLKSRR